MEEHDNPKLYRIRHSLAHVLAQAVLQKFPKAQLGFGPPTDQGFFYDFDFTDTTFTEADLKDLEKAMKKIIAHGLPFEYFEFDYDGAVDFLNKSHHEPYKLENLKNLKDRGVTKFTFYKSGPFLDVCEGPHVEKTNQLPADAFKLDRVAGAYWLGDEKNKMLTRIYALAFETREQLDDYIKRRKLAEEYDHKKLGKELEIYHYEDIVGKGLPLWLPNGTVIRDQVQRFAEEMEFKYGYKRVATPNIAKGDLYLRSQHLPAYRESMFPPIVIDEDEGKKTEYYLKPMNCPHHHLIYSSRKRSYRELPLRLAEYGNCYRYEQSGEVSGLIRVRCMSMNDAHIYLRESQFDEEFDKLLKMYKEFYDTFGLSEYKFRLSLHDKSDEKFKGDEEMWTKGERLLEEALKRAGLPYYHGVGEAAFYGPKIDIQFRNLMGREETVSTIQVDFLSPRNFELAYTDEHGQDQMPIIIHRAPLSTLERFISYLIEYYGGAFPTWAAPIQAVLIPVTDAVKDYAQELADELHAKMVRVELDETDNSFNKKIRTHAMRKIPMQLIIGQKEQDEKQVTIRRYGIQEQVTMGRDEFVSMVLKEIKDRTMHRKAMGSLL